MPNFWLTIVELEDTAEKLADKMHHFASTKVYGSLQEFNDDYQKVINALPPNGGFYVHQIRMDVTYLNHGNYITISSLEVHCPTKAFRRDITNKIVATKITKTSP